MLSGWLTSGNTHIVALGEYRRGDGPMLMVSGITAGSVSFTKPRPRKTCGEKWNGCQTTQSGCKANRTNVRFTHGGGCVATAFRGLGRSVECGPRQGIGG